MTTLRDAAVALVESIQSKLKHGRGSREEIALEVALSQPSDECDPECVHCAVWRSKQAPPALSAPPERAVPLCRVCGHTQGSHTAGYGECQDALGEPTECMCPAYIVPSLESALDRYERLAEEFRHLTGFLAPGKDAPPGLYTEEQDAQRRRDWTAWLAGRTEAPPERGATGRSPAFPGPNGECDACGEPLEDGHRHPPETSDEWRAGWDARGEAATTTLETIIQKCESTLGRMTPAETVIGQYGITLLRKATAAIGSLSPPEETI